MNPIEFVERGGAVRRFHATTTLLNDTVASHSFHVAWIATLLWDSWKDAHPSTELLLACLSHDLAEQEFGDIPAPTKRAVAAMAKVEHLENAHLEAAGFGFHRFLNTDEKFILKLADTLDGLRFCNHEFELGNMRIKVIQNRYVQYVDALMASRPDTAALRPIVAMLNGAHK